MKIVFVTGGVVSSLGKGIIASSLGRLWEDQGVSVGMMKCDPYLNIDPGTMSPIEHGEVFVTEDGGETDLDLGHYERFLNKNLTKKSSLTSGKVYLDVLNKERHGYYEGKTVQVIPHITDKIKEEILDLASKYDVLIVEIGGSVGDIESLAYTETIRQIKYENINDVVVVHAGYVPYINASKELKTKPIQRSINLLRSLGVSPDFIVTRSEMNLTEKEIRKIGMFSNVEEKNIFQSVDAKSIYEIPLILKEQNFNLNIADKLGIFLDKKMNHDSLEKLRKNLNELNSKVKIGIVGKYVENIDSYISVTEALKHAGIFLKTKVEYEFIDAKNKEFNISILKKYDGILVPGGFGESGVDNIIKSIKFARDNNVPYLGICYGMQLAIVEFAKNVLNLNVEHGEIKPNAKNKIIDIMPETKDKIIGGSMRLGEYECSIDKDSKIAKIYDSNKIKERHRHRYEFNNDYAEQLENNGLKIVGRHEETGLAEIIEYEKNDFFVATQFHPELSSKITNPNKIFIGFLEAVNKNK